jgi:hypothetical protein
VGAFYWERHPDGPFATLIAVAATYCTPEAYDGAYDDLINWARAPEPEDEDEDEDEDEEIRAFKAELQQALADPGQLPGDELFRAVDYDDGSDEAFLRRLWHDLYGDQHGAGADPHRGLDAAYYEDLAGRLYGLLIGLDDRLDHEDARQLHHFIEVGEYGLALQEIADALAHATVPITDQERTDMLTLTATMNMDDLVPRALGFCPRAGSAAPT